MNAIELKVGTHPITFTNKSVTYGGKEYLYGLMSDISPVDSPFPGYQFTYEGQRETLYYNINDKDTVSKIFDQIMAQHKKAMETAVPAVTPQPESQTPSPAPLMGNQPLDPEAIAAMPDPEVPKDKKTSGIVINKKVVMAVCVALLLVLAVIAVVLVRNTIAAKPAEPTTTTTGTTEAASSATAADATKIYKGGKYLVGTDMPAGEYLIQGNGYLVVTSDSSDNLDNIITNGNYSNRMYIQVSNKQYFEFEGEAQLSQYAPDYEGANPLPSGMYKVGKDLPAGKYTLQAEGDAYMAIMSNSLGTIDSIVSNKNFTDTLTVTLQDGQFIKLLNCTLPLD